MHRRPKLPEYIDLTTTEADRSKAFLQVCQAMEAMVEPSIVELVRADILRNAARIRELERIIKSVPGQATYSVLDALIMSLVHVKRHFSTTPIIASSSSIDFWNFRTYDYVQKGPTKSLLRTNSQNFSAYNFPDKTLKFGKDYKEPSDYTSYEFVDVKYGARDSRQDAFLISHPVVYFEHRLLAELHQLGLLEEFKKPMAKLVQLTNHDFVHAVQNLYELFDHIPKWYTGIGFENTMPYLSPAGKVFASLYYAESSRSDTSIAEEPLAFSLNSQIFHNTKRAGFARELTRAVNVCMNILNNPRIQNTDAANDAMKLIKMLVSNYVDRDKLSDDHTTWFGVLMKETAAGKLPQNIYLRGRDEPIQPANFPFLIYQALPQSLTPRQQAETELWQNALNTGRLLAA